MNKVINVFVVYYKDIMLNKVFCVREKMFIHVESIICMRTRIGKEAHSVIVLNDGKSYHIKETLEELNKTLQEKLEEKIISAYKHLVVKNKMDPNIRELQRKIGSRDLPNGAAQLRAICAALDLSIKPTKVRNVQAKV